MNTILAILLGSYYAGRKTLEKSRASTLKSRMEDEFQAGKARKEAFIAKYCDEDIEEAVNLICERKDPEYYLMEDTLYDNGIMASDDLIRLSLLAKRGKIPFAFTREGMRNGLRSQFLNKEENLKHKANFLKFLRWYLAILKENGMDERIYFRPSVWGINKEIWEIDNFEDHDIFMNGVFIWEPLDFALPF